ncbi:MAG TPA: hypothetical protein VJ867_03305 [Gemmatimonadaceae bacterium]|nr:hypothetical protein [Gemmatimonadaceae bacterium]
MRVGGIVLGAGAVVAVLVAALIAIAPWSRSNAPEAAELPAAPAPKAVAKRVAAPPRAVPKLAPAVSEGRTDLGDSVFAERSGPEVIVRFDNSALRTRFEEKFERTLRVTLPRVYGPAAQAALDAVNPGALVRGDLLGELPQRGIDLALPNGETLVVYPMTRPGEDGPLVIAYRATLRS